MNAYQEFWCDSDMQKYDPAGCGMGLALGNFILPAIGVFLVGFIIFQLLTSNNKEDK